MILHTFGVQVYLIGTRQDMVEGQSFMIHLVIVVCLTGKLPGSKYPNTRYLPKAGIVIPDIETLSSPYLGTWNP